MDLKYFLCVAGLVLFIEGLPYFAFPGRLKKILEQMTQVPEPALRGLGLGAMALGLALVWLGRA